MISIKNILAGASLVAILTSNALAVNNGKVLYIAASGSNDTLHPNIVQVILEGNFLQEGCSSDIAGFHEKEKHLLSVLLTAQSTGSKVSVQLDPTQIYYPEIPGEAKHNRCHISRVTIDNRP